MNYKVSMVIVFMIALLGGGSMLMGSGSDHEENNSEDKAKRDEQKKEQETKQIQVLRSKDWAAIKKTAESIAAEYRLNPQSEPSEDLISELILAANRDFTTKETNQEELRLHRPDSTQRSLKSLALESTANTLALVGSNSRRAADFFTFAWNNTEATKNPYLHKASETFYQNISKNVASYLFGVAKKSRSRNEAAEIAILLSRGRGTGTDNKEYVSELLKILSQNLEPLEIKDDQLPNKWRPYIDALSAIGWIHRESIEENPEVSGKIRVFLENIALGKHNNNVSDYQIPLLAEVLIYLDPKSEETQATLKSLVQQAEEHKFDFSEQKLQELLTFAKTGQRESLDSKRKREKLDLQLKWVQDYNEEKKKNKKDSISETSVYNEEAPRQFPYPEIVEAILQLETPEEQSTYLEKLIPAMLKSQNRYYRRDAGHIVLGLWNEFGLGTSSSSNQNQSPKKHNRISPEDWESWFSSSAVDEPSSSKKTDTEGRRLLRSLSSCSKILRYLSKKGWVNLPKKKS